MKKSVLIGVLAALMLFAFTACSQSPNTPLYGAQVESVTVAEQPVYIVSPFDKINPAEITFSINYNNGTSEKYTGAQLGSANVVLADTTVNALSKSVKVVVDGYDFYATVKAYAPTSASVDLSSADAIKVEKGKGYEGITTDVTLSSAGGEKLFEDAITWNVGSAVIDKIIEDRELEVGDTFTVSAADASEIYSEKLEDQYGVPFTFTGEISATYVDGTETKITRITAKQTVEIFEAVDGMAGKKSIGDATIEVKAYDKDGKSVDISTGWTATYYDENGVKYLSVYDEFEAGEYPVTVRLTNNTDKEVYFETEMTLKVTADYPVTYTVKQKNSVDSDSDGTVDAVRTFAPGDRIADYMDLFEFTPATWKSSASTKYTEENEPEYTEPAWTTSSPVIPYNQATGNYKIVFQAENVTAVNWDNSQSSGVPVKAAE